MPAEKLSRGHAQAEQGPSRSRTLASPDETQQRPSETRLSSGPVSSRSRKPRTEVAAADREHVDVLALLGAQLLRLTVSRFHGFTVLVGLSLSLPHLLYF